MVHLRVKPAASLFLASLTLLATSTPLPVAGAGTEVELRQLTHKNFETSVSKDTWFVEFFSPWCGHCKAFKPTWEKLVKSRDDPPRLSLAQVDCVADADLCSKVGIKYYPQMKLYMGGKEIETYEERERNLETLENYLDAKVGPPPSALAPSTSDDDDESSIGKVYNPNGRVLVLDPTNFVSYTSSEPTFVKFYAPWCHHCQKLAPKWTELAGVLKGVVNVAEVNCDAHSALCRKQGVEGYPMLIFYHNGQKADYTSEKQVESMATFIKKAIAPGVVPVTAQDVQAKIDAEEVLYLLLHKKTDTASLKHVKDASKVLLGTPRIYSSSDPALFSRFGLSSDQDAGVLVAIKEGEADVIKYLSGSEQYAAGMASKTEVERWLLKHKFPRVMQLTTDNFISIMKNPTQPYVVLAALSTSDDTLEGSIALLKNAFKVWAEEKEKVRKWSEEQDRETVFVWMDADKWESWLKSQYGIKKTELPAVVIADHQKLWYYDEDTHGRPIQLEGKSISDALSGVYQGMITYKNSENLFERFGRRLNGFMINLEALIWEHPMKSVIIILGSIVGLVWLCIRCIGEDLPNDYVPEKKGRNARLD